MHRRRGGQPEHDDHRAWQAGCRANGALAAMIAAPVATPADGDPSPEPFEALRRQRPGRAERRRRDVQEHEQGQER